MLAVRWLRRTAAVIAAILAAVVLWVFAPTVAKGALFIGFAAMVGFGVAGAVQSLAADARQRQQQRHDGENRGGQ